MNKAYKIWCMSLSTNMSVYEAIEDCTQWKIPKTLVDKMYFVELLVYTIIMLTNKVYYWQVYGLAIGSPPA